MDLSYLEHGEPNWPLEPIDAAAVLTRAVETCQGLSDGAGATVEVEDGPGPVEDLGNGDRLAQVFIHLLSHALKHHHTPSPPLSLPTHRKTASQGKRRSERV